jgi:GTPase-activator protein for Ras-like GTPase
MGRQFVQDILFPVIEDLCKAVQNGKWFEVSPSKLEPKKGGVKRNQKNVFAHSQFFFDRITASYKKVPGSLRKVSELLVKAIAQKFPNSKYIVIGGFYFLRYLCPAIISPEGHGYKSSVPLDRDCRRGLVLVSKVIQQISNGVEFGSKEEFMKPFNNYIRDSIGRVRDYFDQISVWWMGRCCVCLVSRALLRVCVFVLFTLLLLRWAILSLVLTLELLSSLNSPVTNSPLGRLRINHADSRMTLSLSLLNSRYLLSLS